MPAAAAAGWEVQTAAAKGQRVFNCTALGWVFKWAHIQLFLSRKIRKLCIISEEEKIPTKYSEFWSKVFT